MNLLALDTSSTACSVALLIDNRIIARHVIGPMQQAKLILPLIDEIMNESGLELNQLDAIALGCGPGSFTGVRIATSVAQGLAFATGLPLVGVSSLAALAQATYQDLGWKRLLIGVDARIQEVYWGTYEVNEEGIVILQGDEQVCAPENVVIPHDKDWYGAGDAWSVYSTQIPFQPLQTDETRLPMASAILTLAKAKFLRGECVPANAIIPVYLRDNVAKKSIKN